MDDDTVIGAIAPIGGYVAGAPVKLSDLDDEWQKKLKCIRNDDNNGAVWPFEYRERIKELEARDVEWAKRHKRLTDHAAQLEAKVAAMEKALEAADDAHCDHCEWDIGQENPDCQDRRHRAYTRARSEVPE